MKRNQLRHSLIGAITVLTLSGSIAACGDGGSDSDESGNALGLVKAGTLTVATQNSGPPTSFIQNGEAKGMAIDFTDALAKDMGLKVTYTSVQLDAALTQVAGGTYDTVASGIVASKERRMKLAFSSPWAYGYYGLLVKKTSPAKSLDQMNGKQVGVPAASQEETLLKKTYPKVTIREFPSFPQAMTSLKSGQLDGVLYGANTLVTAVKENPDLTMSDTLPLPDPEAYPVAKSNTKLVAALNKAIKQEMTKGTFNKLWKKWHPTEPFPTRLYKQYPDMPKYKK